MIGNFERTIEFQSQQMVCGRAITRTPPYPNVAMYQGRLVVFCTHFCLEAFLADPDRFYSAHNKTENDPLNVGDTQEGQDPLGVLAHPEPAPVSTTGV